MRLVAPCLSQRHFFKSTKPDICHSGLRLPFAPRQSPLPMRAHLSGQHPAFARKCSRLGQGGTSRFRRLRMVSPLARSEEHTSELQSLMRISYAVFCLEKKNKKNNTR